PQGFAAASGGLCRLCTRSGIFLARTADHAGNTGKRPRREFARQKARGVDPARQFEPAGERPGKTETAVVGLVADEHHDTVALRRRTVETGLHQAAANALTLTLRRGDERTEQERGRPLDLDRPEAERTDHLALVDRDERERGFGFNAVAKP